MFVFWLYTNKALAKDKLEAFLVQPGDDYIGLAKTGGEQQRVVRSPLEAHLDRSRRDGHGRCGVDKVAEDVAGLGRLVTMADAARQ